MLISIKESYKQIGILVIMACAIFVCTLFLNFNLDLLAIKEQIHTPNEIIQFEALNSMGKLICGVSGGSLCATSILMLVFYVKNYIDEHKKEIGILKAMGYSNRKISKSFWVFGCNVGLGSLLGFVLAYLFMPTFYLMQNEDRMLPEILQTFHIELFIFLVLCPAVAFACFAIGYAYRKLHQPALYLLKDMDVSKDRKRHKEKAKWRQLSFLAGLKKMTIRSRYSLSFFIFFGAFCFSAMLQMVGSVRDLASDMMAMIILVIGVILSCTTLLLAVRVVVKGNTKTIAMMRIMGYSKGNCQDAILNGYRPLGYLGFVIGTLYQYGLMQAMLLIVFQDIENLPTISFDWIACIVVFVVFVSFYEGLIHLYAKRISSISIKTVMSE